MEKVNITVPAQYERMIQKVLELVEHENTDTEPYPIGLRMHCIINNARHGVIGQPAPFQHESICIIAVHAIKALESIETNM